MTPRFTMFSDVAKIRNQSDRAEFNQIPETQIPCTSTMFMGQFYTRLPTSARNSSAIFSTCVLVARLGALYLDRFEKEAPEIGAAIVDKHAHHLHLAHKGTDQVTIVLDPPQG